MGHSSGIWAAPRWVDWISILDSCGSSGNSAMRRPARERRLSLGNMPGGERRG